MWHARMSSRFGDWKLRKQGGGRGLRGLSGRTRRVSPNSQLAERTVAGPATTRPIGSGGKRRSAEKVQNHGQVLAAAESQTENSRSEVPS